MILLLLCALLSADQVVEDNTFDDNLIDEPSVSRVQKRDPQKVYAFRKENACPATQQTTGACPGWVVDHYIPLCAGGADDPANMVWQEKKESLIKDNWERALCRFLKISNIYDRCWEFEDNKDGTFTYREIECADLLDTPAEQNPWER